LDPGGASDPEAPHARPAPDVRNARRRGLRASAGSGVKAPRHKRLHCEVFDSARRQAVERAPNPRRRTQPGISRRGFGTLHPHNDPANAVRETGGRRRAGIVVQGGSGQGPPTRPGRSGSEGGLPDPQWSEARATSVTGTYCRARHMFGSRGCSGLLRVLQPATVRDVRPFAARNHELGAARSRSEPTVSPSRQRRGSRGRRRGGPVP